MKLTRGYFHTYRISDSNVINESYERTRSFSLSGVRSVSGTTVFISHKHDDLDELKGLLGYLSKNFNVIPYIDSMDNGMPENTCAETANRIKQAINGCNKFLLLATNKALSSKWCNWEVGIADKMKLPTNNIAILPMVDSINSLYLGNEYLEIYPYIDSVTDIYGMKRLNVVYRTTSGVKKTVSLKDWLNNNTNY